MTPIERLMKVRCGCCGAPCDVNMYSDCLCSVAYVDKCKTKCVLHCKCRACVRRRLKGVWRINWTGLHHFYYINQMSRTLCGRVVRFYAGTRTAPAARVRGTECLHCQKRYSIELSGNVEQLKGTQ